MYTILAFSFFAVASNSIVKFRVEHSNLNGNISNQNAILLFFVEFQVEHEFEISSVIPLIFVSSIKKARETKILTTRFFPFPRNSLTRSRI